MNRKSVNVLGLMTLLLLAACGGSSAETDGLSDEEMHATAVELSGTMVALTSEAFPATQTLVPTIFPSETPIPTPTLLPTETEALTRLTIIQTANCRNGPSTNYMILAQIDEGGSYEIAGRNEASTWWYIEPLELNEGCWIFGILTVVEGFAEELPVVKSLAIPLIGNDPRFILYFLIAEDTGGTVACGDNLVAINTGILRTGNAEEDVKISMRALFSIGSPYVSGLRHSGYQSNLQVISAEYSRGNKVVNVYLSGTVIKPDNNCDKERFRVQIFATAQQFDNVTKAYVWVGSIPIGDFLVQT